MNICSGAMKFTEEQCKNKHNKSITCEHYFPHVENLKCCEKLCFYDLDSPFKYRRVGGCLGEFHFYLLKVIKEEKNAPKCKSKKSN